MTLELTFLRNRSHKLSLVSVSLVSDLAVSIHTLGPVHLRRGDHVTMIIDIKYIDHLILFFQKLKRLQSYTFFKSFYYFGHRCLVSRSSRHTLYT